jgi:hypothetical protein
MSGSESSSLEGQMQGRPRSCKGFAIPPRVQRSTGLVHGESVIGYVLVLSGARPSILSSGQVQLEASQEVGQTYSCSWCWSWGFCFQRGLHNVEDEITFANHEGYVFHDSRGFEAGGENELKIVQAFVRRKSQERRLEDKLHAIWFVPLGTYSCTLTKLLFRYCIPMDNSRPALDLKHFDDICPDKNGTSKLNFINWG